ncbi:MAG: peptidoglycan DD-metalloendopeptidase family protein [Casimicrobiaceae bacterium]
MPLNTEPPKFAWPVRIAEGIPGTTTYGISNFVDHDPAVHSTRDYSCGTRTSDSLGGGHRGTDIFPLFGWRKMDNEEAIVVAAAPGTIVLKDDGNPDRSCGSLSDLPTENLPWNAISVRQADGSLTWYGHLKRNSMTPKSVGDTVIEGEFLGAVGSSGSSTGPHLHFEVYDANGVLIDPWAGACNDSTATSWWKLQPPYHDPQIVLMMVSKSNPAAAKIEPPCDLNTHTAATVPQSYYLKPDYYYRAGEAAFFTAFVRDILPGAVVGYQLKRPDGATQGSVAVTWTEPYVAAGYFYASATFADDAPAGVWSMEVTYGGQTQSMEVAVGLGTPLLTTVVDFYNSKLDHFFRTANPAEAAAVDSGASGADWLRTGDDFVALAGTASRYGANAVCRFYGSILPGPNSHFYTGSMDECSALNQLQSQLPSSAPRWNYEEVSFSAFAPINGVCPQQAPHPIYRLYDNRFAQNDSNHRYASRSSAYYQQAGAGWLKEGVALCAVSKP